MRRLLSATISFFIFLSHLVVAQDSPPLERYEKGPISIYPTGGEIIVDGELNETTWQESDAASGFVQNFPTDSLPAMNDTEVMVAYDDKFIYVAATCHTLPAQELQARTLYRDFSVRENDAFAILLNPYNDKLNGYSFEVTAFNSRGERLINKGGNDSDPSWDNKWYSATKINDNSWTLEVAIPFKTLRFKEGEINWRINFIRSDVANNERSVWNWVPINQRLENLDYTKPLIFKTAPEASGLRASLIPSLTVTSNRDFEEGDKNDWTVNPSLDFKVGIGPSVNVDGTINPDFSQIEVDRQQLNLGRFELMFPERRQFFIENSDLFAGFGYWRSQPFFSRRIGLAKNEQGFYETVPITAGLRATGKLTDRARVGVMSVQTQKARVLNEEGDSLVRVNGRNYTVASYQQQIFNRSTISGLFINTQEMERGFSPVDSAYMRLGGADLNLISDDNKWQGQAFYFLMAKEDVRADNFGVSASYNSRNFRMGGRYTYIDEEFDPETGFVPRKGIQHITTGPELRFFPNTPNLNQWGISTDFDLFMDMQGEILDFSSFVALFTNFANTSNARIATTTNYTRLLDNFDPSFTEGEELEAGTEYTYSRVMLRYNSDRRQRFLYGGQAAYGSYFNGTRAQLDGYAGLQWQPRLTTIVDFNVNRIDLPEPYGDNTIFLLSPSLRYSINTTMFLTYITQFNSLADNVGTNIRFQWRFRPVSDLFLVYSDNYTDDLRVMNRGFSFKLIYWI
ncbi:DUF5916 domain-containing protein [Roseivirga sp. BDSF3-8]|uniref:DUF5916 domain-containing protein n=1 Tax=Roseivirga sp. BDSF3-8 TaxID=3241598 RepID=UPI0035320929